MAQRTESRKDGDCSSWIEDGERMVLRSDGCCVSSGSSSSSSSTKDDAPSAARGVDRGGRNMVIATRPNRTLTCTPKDTTSHATKLGNFEPLVLGDVKRYYLANWRMNGYESE